MGRAGERRRWTARSLLIKVLPAALAVTSVVAPSASSAANVAKTLLDASGAEAPTSIDIETLTKTTKLTKNAPRVDSRVGRAKSITLTGPRGLRRDLLAAARIAAGRFGTPNTVIDQATLELVGVERGRRILQITKFPFSIPLSTLSLGPVAASSLFGATTASAIRNDEAVLSKTSARLRKARVGDVLVLRHWDLPKTLVRVRVGAVVDDADAGNAEAVISRVSAQLLGFSRPSRLAAWGDIAKVDKAWTKLVPESYLRRSAAPPTLDSVLSQAELKLTYGEFTVRRDRGRLESDPAWVKANLVRHTYPIIGPVACHRSMVAPLERVMTELVAAGLADLIDARDTKRSGGCFSAREIRTTTGTSGRNLSRHAWAAAIDINPSANPFGAKPNMDARLIYVFRRNGFAWGGTWSIPDGMHFELVGPPRIVGGVLPSSTTTTSTTTPSTTTPSTTSTSTTSTTSISSTIVGGATISSLTSISTWTSVVGISNATARATATSPGRPGSTLASTSPTRGGSTTTVHSTASTVPVTGSTTTTVLAPVAPEPPAQEPSAGDPA